MEEIGKMYKAHGEGQEFREKLLASLRQDGWKIAENPDFMRGGAAYNIEVPEGNHIIGQIFAYAGNLQVRTSGILEPREKLEQFLSELDL